MPTSTKVSIINGLRSPILRLPGEVRMKIYEYAMISNDRYITPSKHKTPFFRRRKVQNVLAVCQQIRREAFHIYFECNTFRFQDGDVMNKFIKALNPAAIAAIKDVFCDFLLLGEEDSSRSQIKGAKQSLERLQGLRKLTLKDTYNGTVIHKTDVLPSDSYAAMVRSQLPKWLEEITVLESHNTPNVSTTDYYYDYCDLKNDGLTELERRELENARLNGVDFDIRTLDDT